MSFNYDPKELEEALVTLEYSPHIHSDVIVLFRSVAQLYCKKHKINYKEIFDSVPPVKYTRFPADDNHRIVAARIVSTYKYLAEK